VLAGLALPLAVAAQDPAPFTEAEIRAILAHGPWPVAAAPDPGNRVSGKPTVVADPDGKAAEIYRRIARRCAVKIAESQKDMTGKFPNIVVQNT